MSEIKQGDCLKELKKLPDESVDMIITSPPYYGLRDYGVKGQLGLEKDFNLYLAKMLAIMAELKRVLKSTGQFWLNMGDCYGTHRDKTEERLFSKKKRKSLGAVRKSAIKQYDKCLLMQPERLAIKMIDEQGWILRNKVKWAKQVLIKKKNKTIGSVMPTSVKDRFNESGEELYFFVKSKKYYSDLDAVRLAPQSELNFERPRMGQGGQTLYEQKREVGVVRQKDYPGSKFNKFNYRVRDAKKKAGQPQFKATEEEIKNYPNKIKYDISDRQRELEKKGALSVNQRVQGFYDTFGGENNPAGKNLPTIWNIQSEPHNFSNELGLDIEHFAIFPQALLEIPIKFGCPKGGIVLDPFIGSGTTALVVQNLNRQFIGIELNSEYIKIAEKRLRQKPLL